MKKLLLLLILSFFSAQSFAGSCPDGSDPVKSVSADGTYFVYKCAGTKESNKTSASSSNKSSKGIEINTYGGEGYISENENPNFDSLRWSLYRKLHYRPIRAQRFYSVQASNPFNFQFDLREDAYIKQQMQTTPLLSYLLYEDGKIVVDEITPKDRFGDMFSDTSMYHSMSMGKSITSYLVGHAICEGKIKSVDSRLDWPILKDTLYDNQKLINLLNMASGDQAYSQNDESSLSIQSRMATEFKGSKKSNAQYNYTNLNTNLVLSYLLYTYGDDDFKRLFDDVFEKKVGIKNEIWLNEKSAADKSGKYLGHQFFTTRYDYLRIAKAMLDDWHNDTCVGKYLKTIHERRIPKNGAQGTRGRVGLPLSYGGFFHTGYKGMENRPVMGMDGNGGQTILIDFERGRIVATLAVFDNMRFPDKASFDYKKISYETIKNGKPASTSIVKKPAEPAIDPQELILYNEARRESDRKSKAYWDDYYDKIFFGSSADGSSLLSEDFENLDQRDLRVSDYRNNWFIKEDKDGNAIYCNKATNDWTEFNFGSQNWSDYSISYKIKLSTKKTGTLETHIRKHSGGGAQYRAINRYGLVAIVFAHPDERVNQGIASGSRADIGDKWSDIQLIASGNSIKYLVNGKVVASTNDDRVTKGAAMIAASANLEVCIDNIVVKKETTPN
jgi:CubicO group peptidase (beta-lactamase class C family)